MRGLEEVAADQERSLSLNLRTTDGEGSRMKLQNQQLLCWNWEDIFKSLLACHHDPR